MVTLNLLNRIACGLAFLCVGSVKAQDKPNFVMMIADDVSWDDIGCYGNKQVKTPNIDRIAAFRNKIHEFFSHSKLFKSEP